MILAASLIVSGTVHAAPPPPTGDPAFWDDYWHGLMAMRQAQWDKAVEAFANSAKRDPADGRPLLASGAARAIVGDFKNARIDLDRARFLKSREPMLWQYAVDAMTGTSEGDRGIPIPRSLQKPGEPTHTFSGVPGHMIQGRDDYNSAYASAVIYELAMPYRAARESNKAVDSPELNAARKKVGRWFANRMLVATEFASRNFSEASRLIQLDKPLEALELLEFARTVYPYDADMALTAGNIWLKAGRPATARAEFTIAATIKTDLTAAYSGRAEAAAMMGDARTAHEDLKHAARYAGALPPGLADRVEKLLNANRVDIEPADLLAELDKLALSGAPVDKLLPLASKLQRSAAERHMRYDELYQNTIRTHEDAIRADRNAINARVELAQYLRDEADLRGEQVEPSRGLKPFRWQFTRATELNRALAHVDDALRIDAKNVSAMVTKADVLAALNRGLEAERLIDQASKIAGPSDANATRLLAVYRKRQISRMLTAAGALRSPRFEVTTEYDRRSDGVWQITRTRRYDPTPADLARADEIEKQARALIAEMKNLMTAAIQASRGTLDGLLLQSAYDDWFGSREQALKLLEQAVKDNPKVLRAHESLIEYLHKLGQHDAATRHEAVSSPLFQTTCAPLLQLTWKHIKEKGWPAMLNDLQQARQLDPTDARATAYLAIAKREIREEAESVALLKVATAIEKARLELDDQGVGSQWPRPAGDLANAMQLHQDLAVALKSAGLANESLKQFVASGDLALRFPPDGVAALMYGAMRPNDRSPEIPAAAPVNGATLASRAHLGAAKELQVAGRNAEARKYLEAAAQNTRNQNSLTPMVSNGKGDSNFGGFAEGASATALIELAKDDIANKRYKEAFERLQNASQAKPTNQERRLINDLTLKIIPHLEGRNPQPMRPTPKSVAGVLIEAAKEQISRKEFRAANQSLNRAAQSRPTDDEKKQIEALLLEIAKGQ